MVVNFSRRYNRTQQPTYAGVTMKPAPFERIREIATTKYAHLTMASEEVKLPNGNNKIFHTVRHPGAVVIIPQCEDKSLLLLYQYRFSVGRWIYEFPAGTLSSGEAPEVCAARELCEETGFAAKSLTPLGVVLPAPGFCDEVQTGFLAQDLFPSAATGDEDEVIEVCKFSITEVLNLARNGEIQDGKSLAFLMRFILLYPDEGSE